MDQFFPEDKDIYVFGQGDKIRSGLDNPSYYFNWNGSKKPTYELAMHNYLSECVAFFLQNGSLNSFISSPESEFLDVVPNKKYYMDVVLDDATGNNKFVNPKGEKEKFGSYSDIIRENLPQYTRAGYDSDVALAANEGFYSVAGAPLYNQDFERQGRVYLNYTDADGNITNLDTDDILTGSEANQNYGYSVSISSGSQGVYFCVGAVQTTGSGQIHMYRYQDSSGLTELGDSPKSCLLYTSPSPRD